MELRPYQRDAVTGVLDYWSKGGGDPLVDMATGTGKSVVIATLVREVVETYGARVIMLVHVRELVEQNCRAVLRTWPGAPIGINSAGLGRRDKRSQILFASIQSVAREDHFSLGPRDVIMIDEAHLRPSQGDGQYRTFIDRMREGCPDLRIVGFTATPYRMDSGLLYGEGAPFDDVVYSYGIGEGVRDGYLSPLVSRLGSSEIDVSGVARRGGEFVQQALQEAANRPSVVVQACRDMVERLTDRRSWIAFCAGVEHAATVAEQLCSMGIFAACVTGETPAHERDRLIRDFKGGRIRCLTNANVLTTGFDAPSVDAIAMLRPTLSTGLYAQMLGRGTRLADGKTNCLVLDYAGNVRRHGPVDAIEIRGRAGGKDGVAKTSVDTVRAKACPNCGSLVALPTLTCPDCGHEWDRKEVELATRPERDAAVMSSEMEDRWIDVTRVDAFRHDKPDGPPSLRIEYLCGFTTYREWVTIEHHGFAGEKAKTWWRVATGDAAPSDVDGCLAAWDEVSPDRAWVQVKRDGKYWTVVARRFERRGATYEMDAKNRVRVIQREQVAA